MPVSSTLASQLEGLPADEKAVVADALWRQLDDQWQPTAAQLTALSQREAAVREDPASTLPLGEEIKRLRR